MKILDLPVKLQDALVRMSSDSGWLNTERQIGFLSIDLPVIEKPLRNLPSVSARDFEDYGLVGALLEDPSQVLPVVSAHQQLLDGQASIYVAMCRHERKVQLVDASAILPKAYALQHSWGALRNGRP